MMIRIATDTSLTSMHKIKSMRNRSNGKLISESVTRHELTVDCYRAYSGMTSTPGYPRPTLVLILDIDVSPKSTDFLLGHLDHFATGFTSIKNFSIDISSYPDLDLFHMKILSPTERKTGITKA
jgi:hypothetical protein